jgi:ankyrin repeat protein
VIFLLTKGAAINAQTMTGYTALHLATRNSKVEVVQTLMSRGCEIMTDAQGLSPLMYAYQQNHQPLIDCFHNNSRLLLDEDESIQSVTRPLYHSPKQAQLQAFQTAIQSNNLRLCQALYRLGFSLDSPIAKCRNCTPLIWAINQEKPDIIKWLLYNGAQTTKGTCNLCDKTGLGGNSAVHAIIGRRNSQVFS